MVLRYFHGNTHITNYSKMFLQGKEIQNENLVDITDILSLKTKSFR
jgi:hypothetical protein